MAIGQINPQYQGAGNACLPYCGLFFTAACIGIFHAVTTSREITDERLRFHSQVNLGDAHLVAVTLIFAVSTIFYSIIGKQH